MNEDQGYHVKSPFSGELTVSELTRLIKTVLEANIPVVAVVGEVSNYIHHTSGHRYFTLKDAQSQLKCVLFRWQAGKLDFEPEEGMMVRAVGNITVYEPSGQYQLTVLTIKPMGRGDLLMRLEALKKKLAGEGVFDNHRPIPPFPSFVGVVTSPTGAAVRDIISVIRRRAPHVQIILRPAQVQGADAATDIVEGIQDLNRYTNADVIIVGRGGGSIEDLWCFNEEIVARAIASSTIPVVSAVGHETDFTLADFAADLRAPTPSAAAELVVRNTEEIKQSIDGYRTFLRQRMTYVIEEMMAKVSSLKREFSPERFMQGIFLKSQHLDELTIRMKNAVLVGLTDTEKRAERVRSTIEALNPRKVLERGYSIVYREPDRRVVTDSVMVQPGDGIRVELARGRLNARVEGTEE